MLTFANENTDYIVLEGLNKVHKSGCSCLKHSTRRGEHIDIQKIKAANGVYQFCKKCCGNQSIQEHEYYVVLDLEMCRVKRNPSFRYKQEIIQIGAVMVNEHYEIISEFSTFVRPEYGKMDYFISKLTGITESQIKSAPLLKEAFHQFISWMDGRVSRVYEWSDSDYFQFKHEFSLKQITGSDIDEFLNLEWIDYQKTFGDRYQYTRAVALEDALNMAEITPIGREHNGLDDAINTASLIEKLENDPNYELSVFIDEEKNESLTFSLGSLFSQSFLQQLALT